MKLQLRLTLLLVGLLAIFLGVLAVMQSAQRRSAFELQSEIGYDKARQLARVLALSGSTLERFATDYTQWDEMCTYVATADPAWATVNLEQSLASWHFEGVWVFAADRREVYRHLRAPVTPADLAAFPSRQMLDRICTPEHRHFFLVSPRGPLELRAAPIHPSDDSRLNDPPQGWLIIARLLDSSFIDQISELTDSRVFFASAAPTGNQTPNDAKIVAAQPLAAWSGETALHLTLEHRSPLLANMVSYDRDEVLLLLSFGLVFLAFAAWFLHRWVRRPLGLIEASLESGRPDLVAPLEKQRDEFAHVALLVRAEAEQRRTLSREVQDRAYAEAELRRATAERIALGRDLHDGIIQSIYAIGMALQGVGPLLRSAPEEAQRRIEVCVEGLNRTIAQLRSHIAGLEESDTESTSLAEGLQQLLREMPPARPVAFEVNLDPILAATLRPDTVVQLLFIAREAISNSVRHGLARRIVLALTQDGPETVFTITDDGTGFDPADTTGHGHGLDNMTRRAEEIGASLAIESSIARGARLRVELPRSAPPAINPGPS